MAMRIMHRLAVKFCTVLRWMLAPRRKISMVALAVIETVINMPVKSVGPVKPGSGANKQAGGKPLRAIVTIRGTVIRRSLIVSIRASRRFSDVDRNLCHRAVSAYEQAGSKHQMRVHQFFHKVDLS